MRLLSSPIHSHASYKDLGTSILAIVDFIRSLRGFTNFVHNCCVQWSRLPQEGWKNGLCHPAWYLESDEHVPRLPSYSYSEIKTL